ncbi:MAG TPA: hypothetical protein PLE14_08820, partial [Anaerolineales bacterium]|nr:hypothetical protein [Anaerolineales bacterium]
MFWRIGCEVWAFGQLWGEAADAPPFAQASDEVSTSEFVGLAYQMGQTVKNCKTHLLIENIRKSPWIFRLQVLWPVLADPGP